MNKENLTAYEVVTEENLTDIHSNFLLPLSYHFQFFLYVDFLRKCNGRYKYRSEYLTLYTSH